jgi:hypothetical protein
VTGTGPIVFRTVGHRTIMNTDHAMYAEVRRFGPKQWVVSLVCNGVAESSRSYTTKRDAMAAYDAYSVTGSPGALEAITRGRVVHSQPIEADW